jgi:hypothetical protein
MGSWTTVAAWLLGLGAAAWVVDRALVACELRGWILYRLSPRPRHEMRRAAGSMLIGVDGLFRPAARHVAAVTREVAVHRESDDEGDGGGPPRPLP